MTSTSEVQGILWKKRKEKKKKICVQGKLSFGALTWKKSRTEIVICYHKRCIYSQNQCLMCRMYGHSDLTSDWIINRWALLTISFPSGAGKDKTGAGNKRSSRSSDLMQSVGKLVWKWTRTRLCLDGADDCAWCGAFSTPAPPSVPHAHLVTAVPPGTQQVLHKILDEHISRLSFGRKRQRLHSCRCRRIKLQGMVWNAGTRTLKVWGQLLRKRRAAARSLKVHLRKKQQPRNREQAGLTVWWQKHSTTSASKAHIANISTTTIVC